ncbi:hypothetical protein [Reichenbachiella carrageenanivorans]
MFLYFYEGLSYAEILDVKVSSARILTYRDVNSYVKEKNRRIL